MVELKNGHVRSMLDAMGNNRGWSVIWQGQSLQIGYDSVDGPPRAERQAKSLGAAIERAAAMEWQPIETAPKDGTDVDLWVTTPTGFAGRVPDCHWHCGEWLRKGKYDEAIWVPVESEGWKVTHWMARPTPPETSDV